MKRAYFLLFFVLFVLLSCKTPTQDQIEKRPNIVLVLTDDQGWGDLSYHGNDSIDTPVLDQLAKTGVAIDRFYVSPVCAPTRASLLTGRYHLRTGCTWVTHRKEVMRSAETTLAEILKSAGYRTGIFGKWHNGAQYPNDPNGQGFDEFYGFSAGHWNNYFNSTLTHNQEEVSFDGYIIDELTDKALQFIETNQQRPFFCYLPYNTPHSPMQVPDRYFEKYKAKGLTDFNACAYGMVENIDDNVGRVLATLDSLELSENTIFIFTTDNGPNGWRYNGGMKGRKAWVDEGGIRVPFFIKYPDGKLTGGRTLKELAAHIDILPTLLDLADLTVPDSLQLDGKSLLPVLLDSTANWPERNIYTFPIANHLKPYPGSVRNNQYRLVFERDSSITLYDMLKDPGQKEDIAALHPGIVEELSQSYLKLYAGVTAAGTAPPPIPLGYPESPVTRLPAPEAHLEGGVHFIVDPGWANDWVTNWGSEQDQVSWALQNETAGSYQVSILYACPEVAVGSTFELWIGDRLQKTFVISEAHAPDFKPSPDRVERSEVYEKEWKELPLGAFEIDKGRQKLVIRAGQLTNAIDFELKAVNIIQ